MCQLQSTLVTAYQVLQCLTLEGVYSDIFVNEVYRLLSVNDMSFNVNKFKMPMS